MPRVLVVFGTRPEAIKLAPVVRQLNATTELDVCVVATGQHRELLDQVMTVFGIVPDHDLSVMTRNQTLPELTSRLLTELDLVIRTEVPDAVLVQGDTSTAVAASLASFYNRTPVGHVEAGLRTNDRYAPFPEEINRRLIGELAQWHFAPTQRCREALTCLGVDGNRVLVTGNTAIDALHYILANTRAENTNIPVSARRLLLVTAHRRESFGTPLERICRAILRIADEHSDLDILYPVHPNPHVRVPVHRMLSNHPRIRLVDPLDYVEFSHMLSRAYLVLTDSGGLQEEAPALGKPVLVMREKTERPEAVESGVAELVGTDEERIVSRVSQLMKDTSEYRARARVISPYGDGRASSRIAEFMRSVLAEDTRPHDFGTDASDIHTERVGSGSERAYALIDEGTS